MNTFGELLREARKSAGLSQAELAARASTKASVHHSYVSAIERGISTAPTRDVVTALLDALGITNKAERTTFLLAAGCASIQDLEGITPATREPSRNTSLPTTLYHADTSIPHQFLLRYKLAAVYSAIKDINDTIQHTNEKLENIKRQIEEIHTLQEEAFNKEEDYSEEQD